MKLEEEKGKELNLDDFDLAGFNKEQFEEIMLNALLKAEEEALLKGIEANTIIINKNHSYTREFGLCYGLNNYRVVPPMLLGKKLFVAPLPPDYQFALFHREEQESEEEKLLRLLKKYVKLSSKGQLIFKRISFKRNKEDYDKIIKGLSL